MTVKELLNSIIYSDSELISIRIDLKVYSFIFYYNLEDYWVFKDGKYNISVYRGHKYISHKPNLERDL